MTLSGWTTRLSANGPAGASHVSPSGPAGCLGLIHRRTTRFGCGRSRTLSHARCGVANRNLAVATTPPAFQCQVSPSAFADKPPRSTRIPPTVAIAAPSGRRAHKPLRTEPKPADQVTVSASCSPSQRGRKIRSASRCPPEGFAIARFRIHRDSIDVNSRQRVLQELRAEPSAERSHGRLDRR